MDDDALCDLAFRELASEQVDRDAWARSIAAAAGNEPLARVAYVELRMQQLREQGLRERTDEPVGEQLDDRADDSIPERQARPRHPDRAHYLEGSLRMTRAIRVGLAILMVAFAALAMVAFATRLTSAGLFFLGVVSALGALSWRTRRTAKAARVELASIPQTQPGQGSQ